MLQSIPTIICDNAAQHEKTKNKKSKNQTFKENNCMKSKEYRMP